MTNRTETNQKLRHSQADLQHLIDMFGDHLAKKHQYKHHTGIEAVWYFLVQKHHWTPATVRALNTDDLQFLLDEEMVGWTLPADAKS